VVDGVQLVRSTLSANRYPAIVVQAGLPVRWTITAPPGSINGCNNRMIIREYGIEHPFRPGDNLIEFTPQRTGRIAYSCWMGMIRSTITVVAEGESLADAAAAPPPGGRKRIPAGVDIPAETLAVAALTSTPEGVPYQEVTITLRDEGFEPSVVVMQRNLPALWVIDHRSLEPGNAEVLFPAYDTTVPMQDGDNPLQLIPTADFDFSTADPVYYGLVKVVDDLGNVDLEAVRAAAAGWETYECGGRGHGGDAAAFIPGEGGRAGRVRIGGLRGPLYPLRQGSPCTHKGFIPIPPIMDWGG
jgi:plastocyanin domain-containing protein